MKKPPTTTEAFEALLKNKAVEHHFRLYVGGPKPKSARALWAVKKVCEEHLPGRYQLEIVDIFQDRDAAKRDQIVAVPTLIRLSPQPVRRLVGSFPDPDKILKLMVLIGDGGRDET